MNSIDLLGKKFGKLTIVSFNSGSRQNKATWTCMCDCGNTINAITGNLKNGNTKSCGCIKIDRIANLRKTHGFSNKIPEYRIWCDMKNRCLNKNNSSFYNYGGRGISVCKSWRLSFYNFYNNMGKRPSLNHSIDRINVNGNYEQSNCRWATSSEQSINKRNNKLYSYNGITLTVSQWVKKIGISRTHFYREIKKNDFSALVLKHSFRLA